MMTGKKRDQQFWAIEFAGEQVRLCRFDVHGERVAVKLCETRPSRDFDFPAFEAQAADDHGETRILCTVPRNEVMIKPFVVPRGEGIDLRKVTALKLEQSIANLESGATLWGLVDMGAPEEKRAHVLTAAVSREYIDGLVGTHFTNEERPATIECAALAALRAHQAGEKTPLACELFIDCAPDGISVFLLKGGLVDSTHFIAASRTLEEAFGEIRRLVLFMRRGEAQSGRSGPGGPGGLSGLSGQSGSSGLSGLPQTHTASTASTASTSSPFQAITCLGGSSADQLALMLREALGLPVADRLEGARRHIDRNDSLPADWETSWHRIVGLIELAREGGPARAINFVAFEGPKRKTRTRVPGLERISTTALAIVFVGLLAATFFVNRSFNRTREGLMQKVIVKSNAISGELQRNEQTLARLKRYQAEKYSVAAIIFKLAEVAPGNITLDQLALLPKGPSNLMGRCPQFSEGQELARKMNESNLFAQAATSSLRKERDRVVFKTTFVLTAEARRSKKP
jgi:hypothetical protein